MPIVDHAHGLITLKLLPTPLQSYNHFQYQGQLTLGRVVTVCEVLCGLCIVVRRASSKTL